MNQITDKPKLLSDSITLTLEQVKEVVRGLPREAQYRAKAAAVNMERAFMSNRTAGARDPAIAIGTAFAVFTIAERLIQLEQEAAESGRGLIQLL